MLGSFRHKGLRRLFDTGDGRDLRQDQLKRVRRILSILDSAGRIEDIERLPGLRLHAFKHDLAGFWSVSVSGNWRIIFRFEDGQVLDVDLVDYH